MTENYKPTASVSLDLDNLWSYMKTHGDPGWESFPSYLDILIPKVLNTLDKLKLKISFFIVGQDAALEKNRDILRALTCWGHEVCNHSFHHEPWLHLYEKDQIEREIALSEEHISRATGQRPVGFRGPGFSWNADLLEVLAERGYTFDASTLPTYLGPLARAYYFRKADLSDEDKKKRGELFGSFSDGLRPIKPYRWLLPSGATMLEIPVTTMPIFKVPFHLSYLIYLSRFSMMLMSIYLKMALSMCRLTGTNPSFLLHPLDMIGGDDVKKLAFFPGMDISGNRKTVIFEKVLGELSKHYALVNMSSHASSVLGEGSSSLQNRMAN